MLAPVIGITPAWAGKRGFLIAESLIIWDHPRVGGEKILEPKRQTGLLGSPPRGRGKGAIQKGGVTHSRITPAWAGKSIVKVPLIIPVQDHPRVGGEKSRKSAPARRWTGSPPRGRGKADRASGGLPFRGITPAWAGKRQSGVPLRTIESDHPRVGGEKHLSGTTDNRPQGSPPRGRGKVRWISIAVACAGITPAWAGKSPCPIGLLTTCWDHPRVGGEKTKKIP